MSVFQFAANDGKTIEAMIFKNLEKLVGLVGGLTSFI